MGKKKLTKADHEARQEARRNSSWLRELAERRYADLEHRGMLTIPRPGVSTATLAKAEIEGERAQARANSAWLRELAEKAKADLDQDSEFQ